MSRSILIAVGLALTGPNLAWPSEEVSKVLDRFDKNIDRARKTYNRALKSATEKAVRQLETIARRSVKSKEAEAATLAYKEILRMNRDHEEARAFFAEQGKLAQRLTQLTREWAPAIMPGVPEWEQQVFFETMLGKYDNGRLGVVNLAVPAPGTLLNRHIVQSIQLAASQARRDAKIERYDGSGNIVVPRDGQYVINVAAGSCEIDGKSVGDGEVHLKGGLHIITFEGWEAKGSLLEPCAVEIRDKNSNRKIPIFNSLADIKTFLSTRLSGQMPVEVSGWEPEKMRPLRIEFPGS